MRVGKYTHVFWDHLMSVRWNHFSVVYTCKAKTARKKRKIKNNDYTCSNKMKMKINKEKTNK